MKEKKKIFRETWKKIFQISEEENDHFDKENYRIVKNQIQQKTKQKINPLDMTL